jgi:hypothetical protein
MASRGAFCSLLLLAVVTSAVGASPLQSAMVTGPPWPAFGDKAPRAMVFDRTSSARSLPNLERLHAIDRWYRCAWGRSADPSGHEDPESNRPDLRIRNRHFRDEGANTGDKLNGRL